MKRIMFVGPSGIGKTTLAKFIETKYGIPFISGSMSDLMPDTKEIHHAEFLHQECGELINKDYQLLNLRNKLFKDKETFVTDRSYVDLAAYFIYKQSTNIPECEVDAFLDICMDGCCEHLTHLQAQIIFGGREDDCHHDSPWN